jgi:hypothetical protein
LAETDFAEVRSKDVGGKLEKYTIQLDAQLIKFNVCLILVCYVT